MGGPEERRDLFRRPSLRLRQMRELQEPVRVMPLFPIALERPLVRLAICVAVRVAERQTAVESRCGS